MPSPYKTEYKNAICDKLESQSNERDEYCVLAGQKQGESENLKKQNGFLVVVWSYSNEVITRL